MRTALAETLELIEEALRPHLGQLFMLRSAETQWALLRLNAGDEGNYPQLEAEKRAREHEKLRDQETENIIEIGSTGEVEAGAVVDLCDQIIDVASQDIKGRYYRERVTSNSQAQFQPQ